MFGAAEPLPFPFSFVTEKDHPWIPESREFIRIALIHRNGASEEAEEDRRVHQLEAGARNEVGQIRLGLQADPQDSEAGQG